MRLLIEFEADNSRGPNLLEEFECQLDAAVLTFKDKNKYVLAGLKKAGWCPLVLEKHKKDKHVFPELSFKNDAKITVPFAEF